MKDERVVGLLQVQIAGEQEPFQLLVEEGPCEFQT